jgi:hypothetical protein
MKKWMVAMGSGLALAASVHAAEIFPDAKLKAIKQGDVIAPGDTVGGYPIFTGGVNWTFVQGSVTTSSRGTPLASMAMFYNEGTTPVATQFIDAALISNDGGYWTGSPCGQGHLVMINKPRGREDHCLTIDPSSIQMATGNLTKLNLKITNTASASRMYNVSIQVSPEALGWRGSNTGDWTKDTIETQPMRKEFMARLTEWGEKLLDAGIKAIDYTKPQDVYANIPSPTSLLPSYEKYKAQKYSLGFLSLLEDLKHRPGIKAIAFSHYGDYKTRSGSAWNAESQDDANARAIARCEEGRPTSAPACTLFKED